MKHDQRFVWLDLVRGLSAIAVCAGHLRAATLVNFGDLQASSHFHKLFYFLTGLGHQAVMVFFVLSGLFVGSSILKSGRQFQPSVYTTARLSRLWIVLIPCLILTLIVDTIVAEQTLAVERGECFSLWCSGPDSPADYSRSALSFLGNVCFLQTITVPVYGTNAPLWSLANEFWYYVMFPLLAFAIGLCGDTKRITGRVVATAAAVGLLLAMTARIREGYLIWLMGVGVYYACTRISIRRRPLALIGTFGLFAGSLVHSKSNGLQALVPIPSDYVVGACFSLFCIVIATWPAPGESIIGKAITRFSNAISEFSYSLYLSHFPIVVLISVFVYKFTKVQPTTANLTQFFAWLGLLMAFGTVFWFLYERHTNVVKKMISSRILRQPQALPVTAPAVQSDRKAA